MDFEEMKVIWDTQNEAPLYAIDQAALQATVRRKARGFKRLVLFFETVMMAVVLGLSLLYIVEPFLEGQNYHTFIAATILLAAATRFFVGIRHRWHREAEFDPSLLGDLNKALWQVEYHIARSRAARLWLILPLALAFTIDVAFRLQPTLFWLWLGTMVLMSLATWGIETEIRCLYLPKKRKLEALRDKLVDPQN